MNNKQTTLTEVAYWTRKIIKISGILIIFLLIGGFSFRILSNQWKKSHPPPPPPPDTLFGTLPKFKFQEPKKKPDKFSLETVTNQLPELPNQAKVYFILPRKSKILAFEEMQSIATRLGFISQPEKIKEDLFFYKNPLDNSRLTINPLTQNLEYEYPFQTDQTIINQNLPPNVNQITQKALGFLQRIGMKKDDLNPEGKITLYQLTATQLLKAPSISEANLAKVDFFKNNLEENVPILPPSLNDSNISVWVSGEGSKEIVKAKFIYFQIDKEKFSTYPLRSISQAWEELQNGHYHLAKISDRFLPEQKIAIRKIYLAYLDPDYPFEFLKPIYVFEGDNEFVGYVEAVSPEFLSE